MCRRIRYIALDKRVIAVAIEGQIKDWAAYIGAVPGNNHDREFKEVAAQGTKLRKEFASLLFPDFNQDFTWRP